MVTLLTAADLERARAADGVLARAGAAHDRTEAKFFSWSIRGLVNQKRTNTGMLEVRASTGAPGRSGGHVGAAPGRRSRVGNVPLRSRSAYLRAKGVAEMRQKAPQ